MRLATLHVPQDARGALRQPKIPPGTFWVRFGDEVLLYAEDTKWNDVVERDETEQTLNAMILELERF